MKQPHEGVRGTQREASDPLLNPESAELLGALMKTLNRSTLVANRAPVVQEIFSRLHTPRIGDAVVVYDSLYQRDPITKHQGLGYLVELRSEWACDDEEWAAALKEDSSLTDADRFPEPFAWYIQYGPQPQDICRWTNCTVLAIPAPEPNH